MARRKKSTFERLTTGSLNRKQRRDLGRRLVSDDPGLRILHAKAGGIDGGWRVIWPRCRFGAANVRERMRNYL